MDTRSSIADPADHALDVHHTYTATTDSDAAPMVRWPDPSPLEHWWTEVMDGALRSVSTPPAER